MAQRRQLIVAVGWVLATLAVLPSPADADLLTFGYSNARLGTSPAGAGVAPAKVRRLVPVWRAQVGGAVNGQALVVDGQRVAGRRHDIAFVATEHGSVVALDTSSGRPLWKRRVSARSISPDCEATPDGRFGVTATMAIDLSARRLYVVDVDGLAWAFALSTGRVQPGWPVRVHPRGDDFVWGGLALSGGRLYVAIASLCDGGRYYGGVAAVQTGHPASIARWRTTAGTGAFGAGIWGWGGVSIDSATGNVYAATGNSLGTTQEDDGDAESIVALDPGLQRIAADDPLRGPFASGDRDFGTTPLLIAAPGCPRQLVAINKIGQLFLYNRDRLSDGPTQRLPVAADNPDGIPLIGMPAYDPSTRTLVLTSPSAPANGALRAGVQAFTLTTACRLTLKWQQSFDPPDAGSPPTIADGVAYIATGRNGWLRAFRLSDGARLLGAHIAHSTVFAAPTVDHGTVYVGTWNGELVALRPAH